MIRSGLSDPQGVLLVVLLFFVVFFFFAWLSSICFAWLIPGTIYNRSSRRWQPDAAAR